MATIVEFRSPPRRAPTPSAMKGGSADIVIFPGVRYERLPETEATKTKKTKRSRDTLHLES
jgi:hypothetical protein